MKMLGVVFLAIVFFCASGFAFHHGGCAEGNDAVVMQEWGGDSFTACCVSVGGGQLSCTAGGCWFNSPEGPSQTAQIVPDCAIP